MHKQNLTFTGQVAVPTVVLFCILTLSYGTLWWAYVNGYLANWATGIIGAFLTYGMFTVVHEASHGNISGGRKNLVGFEKALGWLAGVTLFFPYSAFVAIHLQHHAHTNDPDQDPDGYVKGKSSLEIFARCVTLIGYYYVHSLGKESRENAALNRTRRQTIIFLIIILTIAAAFILSGNLDVYFFVFVMPALLAAPFLGFTFDWLPHYPHHNMGAYHNTRIVTVPGLEFLSLFQSYHLIHHLYPRVPFYKYKSKFKAIEAMLVEKKAPVEGFRKDDSSLFNKQNTYVDLIEGSSWKYNLEVEDITQLTHDSALIRFKRLAGLPFQFIAGQYVVITMQIDSLPVSRCYSICANPDDGNLEIAVKRVPGGKVSNAILDRLEKGSSVIVSGPFGNFSFQEAVGNFDNHIFIAGGSGITPVLSIIQKALADGQSGIKLVYGCRSAKDVMFKDKLETLASEYPARFDLHITYELLDAAYQRSLLSDIAGHNSYYLCGPQAMMDASQKTLSEKGVAQHDIILEEFSLAAKPLSGSQHRIKSASGEFKSYESETILEAAIRQDKSLPYACGMGQCGTCKAKLTEGEVGWKDNDQSILLQNEIEEGYILTCSCYAKNAVKLKF